MIKKFRFKLNRPITLEISYGRIECLTPNQIIEVDEEIALRNNWCLELADETAKPIEDTIYPKQEITQVPSVLSKSIIEKGIVKK